MNARLRPASQAATVDRREVLKLAGAALASTLPLIQRAHTVAAAPATAEQTRHRGRRRDRRAMLRV